MREINKLKKQLYDERNKNQILTNENNNLKNIINNLKKENEKIKQLEYELNKKNIEIQNIQNINNRNNEYTLTSFKPGEKIMVVNFATMGSQDIGHYALACKNTDLFVRLEERLYKDYPKYKNYETFFEINTKRIKRFKTLDENKIKNNDIITIFIIEENQN